MNNHYVRTIEIRPEVTLIQKELILELKIDETIENRFPFDDIERNEIEIHKQGTQVECQNFINNINKEIRKFFKVDCCIG
jgi:hypothetical protein